LIGCSGDLQKDAELLEATASLPLTIEVHAHAGIAETVKDAAKALLAHLGS
jgi:hypothetical protein